MKALLLVGGLGTRLKQFTSGLPKPMAEVGGKPFLEYLIYQLVNQGFRDIIFCIGYLGDKIQRHFGNGDRWGVHIEYSWERISLGTAGAIKLATKKFADQNFLVMNGDSLLIFNINKLIKFHQKKMAKATIALLKVYNMKRFGKVEVNTEGEVLKFVEKGAIGKGVINGGVYVLNRKILNYIPGETECSLESEVFPKLIGNGCYGMVVENAFFVDIGTPEAYRSIQEKTEELFARLRLSKKRGCLC